MADINFDTVKDLVEGAAGTMAGLADAAKAFKSVREVFASDKSGKDELLKKHLMELSEALMAAQEQNLALRQTLLNLQEQLGRREEFSEQASKFLSREVSENSIAFVLVEPKTDAERAMRYCSHCFGNKKLSLLQFGNHEGRYDRLICTECKSAIRVPNEYAKETSRPLRVPSSGEHNWMK